MVEHLQHFFAKMTNARQTPEGGGGWAPMELIETLYTHEQIVLLFHAKHEESHKRLFNSVQMYF
jgi:hypothetical protein